MIKKMFLGLVIFLGLLIGTNAWALDYTYTESGGKITITGYTGPGGDIVVPDTIEGLPVVSIGDNAFRANDVVTGVTLPDSVTSIGEGAFLNCFKLTGIIIPDSVTVIGYEAFYFCPVLTSLTIGSSVTSIGGNAFWYCIGLTSITIPDSVVSIGPGAFEGCENVSSVTIGNGVISIGDSAFRDCFSLTSLTIGSSVEQIGREAFLSCTNLTRITIPDRVTSIGWAAFAECTSLASVTIPDSVTSIGWLAFSRCVNLRAITIPGSVNYIEPEAFAGCSSLSIAYFLGDAPAMESDVFQNCASDFNICYKAEATGFTTPIWNPTPENSYPAAPCDCSNDSDCAEGHTCSDGLCMLHIAQPSFGKWTWMSGANTTWQAAIYGTKGVPDAANIPGARESCVSWIDNFGNLWLFGGYGMGISGEYGALNELWRYNISSGQWTWMSGSDTVDQPGFYGTIGVPDAANVPGSRWGSISWTDNSGNFWLFGGGGVDDYLNDLWRYDPDTNMWTWMSGPKTIYQDGLYGTKGVPDAANVPDSREKSVSWTDSSGNLWLFGGQGNSLHNDLWRYEPDTGMWTWMSGSNTGFQNGVYGTMGVPDAANVPGSRWGSISWTDNLGNFWLFGGQGLDIGNSHSGWLNDLWRYDPDTNMWTWMSGSDTKNQDGVYGTMGVPDAANMPGGLFSGVSWTDDSGNLWFFGAATVAQTTCGAITLPPGSGRG